MMSEMVILSNIFMVLVLSLLEQCRQFCMTLKKLLIISVAQSPRNKLCARYGRHLLSHAVFSITLTAGAA